MMLLPTIGQLERTISQQICTLYSSLTGFRPQKILCHFFDKEIVISLENFLTPIEKTLLREGHEKLAKEIRFSLDKIIVNQLKIIINDVIKCDVLDVMNDSNINSNRTGIIVILDKTPEVKNPEAIPKNSPKQPPNSNTE
jgi:uncharacterized protein YbcI